MDKGARALVDFIRKNYESPKELAEFIVEDCVYEIQNGGALGEVIKFLQTQLEIDSMDMIQAFADLIAPLHNNTKQWFIKGYSPNELGAARKKKIPSLPAAQGVVIDFTTRQKVGRNDPCPCGSGKKFKKCCGN